MAGVNIESGKSGARRSVDADINMIPFIDLLMVTISFLLLTAVWTHMSRLDATAQVPGSNLAPPCESAPSGCPSEKVLHVDMRSRDQIVLDWKEGVAVVRTLTLPRSAESASSSAPRAGALASALKQEWTVAGLHRESSDRRLDRAVLHTDNAVRYAEIVAVLDAIHSVQRPLAMGSKTDRVPAFSVALAEN